MIETKIFLHGLGNSPEVWDDIRLADDLVPSLSDWLHDSSPTYQKLYQNFEKFCLQQEGNLELCGHSLGAILALEFSIRYPEKVSFLTLIAGQYKISRRLLKIQNFIFRFLPESNFKGIGLRKKEAISFMESLVDLDLDSQLSKVTAPTLVLCGTKDKANKRAAVDLATKISNARLEWITGAGHQLLDSHGQEIRQILENR